MRVVAEPALPGLAFTLVVLLQCPSLDGGRWEGQVPVTPTLAGTLRSGPSPVWPSRDEANATLRAPQVWTIR